MIEKFGNYTLENTDASLRLTYVRTAKDWMDALISGVMGIGSLAIVGAVIFYSLQDGFEWIYLIVILLFGFFSYMKLGEMTMRLIYDPVGEVLRYDKENGIVYWKSSQFKTRKSSHDDIVSIDYHLHTDWVDPGGEYNTLKKRYWAEAELVVENESRYRILAMNPNKVIDIGAVKIERELRKNIKGIAEILSDELGVDCRWKGIIKEK